MAMSLKCRMCGGDLDIIDGGSVAECEYCGSRQTVPQVDDEKLAKLYELGIWRGAPLTWRSLKEEDGRALVICTEVIEQKEYHESFEDITWEKCDLRKWLNGEFYETAFSAAERARIAEMRNENPDNAKYGTKGGAATKDKVFCLSIDEAEGLFGDWDDRKCGPSQHVRKEDKIFMSDDESGAAWWLRSPGSGRDRAANVYDDGDVFEDGWDVFDDNIGVRPALWLNLES